MKVLLFRLKNKKRGGPYIIVPNEALHFKYVSKEKTKQRQAMKNEIKEEIHLNYTTAIKYAFNFIFC